jgi:DNA-binding GntR family transcriptional regulator
MARIGLNPGIAVPLYRQLAGIIRSDITQGRIASGARVPSVRELRAEFSCSVHTAEAAMRLLAGEGLVVMSPGRGFFVAERPELLAACPG